VFQLITHTGQAIIILCLCFYGALAYLILFCATGACNVSMDGSIPTKGRSYVINIFNF